MLRRFFPFTISQGGASLPFISQWNTANTSVGSSASNQVALPLSISGTYDFTVEWGDGNSDLITVWNQAETTHTYGSSGTYTITITGIIVEWGFNNGLDRLKILDVSQFGSVEFSTRAFYGCSNFDISATDAPILPSDLSLFFTTCSSLVGNSSFDTWDVSAVINFNAMFQSCVLFNQPIGSWDVGLGTSFNTMFNNASIFNQDISGWNMVSAEDLGFMFRNADAFNQPIGTWNVSNVTSMAAMFRDCQNFNQNISSWNVGNVDTFASMFRSSLSFNQPIGSWNMISATSLNGMFLGATAFDQNIGSWNVTNVTDYGNFMFGKTNLTFSATNLDAIYNGWSLLTLSPNEAITFGTAKYTLAGQAGRDVLTNPPNNWIITDGGLI